MKTILGAMIMGLLPMVLSLPSLAATILSAPLLLLVPAGVGNALAFGLRGALPHRLSKLQSLLIAYFTGTLLIILVFLLSERLSGARTGFLTLATPIYLLSVIGWLRLGEAYRLKAGERKRLMVVAAISLPLVALRYAYSISIFSDYPVTDLFQRSHFHGGAFEFARNFILNPFATDSYIPFQQLFLGMLMRLTGADPLDAEWVWPVAMAPIQIATLLCLIERLLPNRRTTLIALAIALAQFALSNPTNGSMAEMVAILLLSVLLPRRDRMMSGTASAVELLTVVPALLIGVALTKLPSGAASFLVIALVLVGNLTRRPLVAQIWPVLVLTAIALLFHRGALLFVALVVALSCGLSLLCIVRRHYCPSVVSRGVVLATIGVLSLLTAMCVKILVFSRGEGDIFGLWSLFDLVLTPITGKSLANVALDGDLAPGVGARVALFEAARTVSPLAVLLMLIGVFGMLSLSARRLGSGPSRLENAREIHLFADITLLFFGFILLILTGFPFIHRAAFLITLLASATLAILVCNASTMFNSYSRLSLSALSYMLVVMALPFLLLSERAEPYLWRALPVLLAMACVGVLAVVLALVWGRMRSLPLILAVTAAVAMEFAVSRSYFKSYAFHNQPPPANGALAAYDRTDLDTARRVLALSKERGVLVSDPKTMTIMRSRTGLYPLVSSSNLDTLSSDARRQLMAVLTTALSPSPLAQTCHRLVQIANSDASGLYNYGSIRLLSPAADGVTILTSLGYNNRLVPTYDPIVAARQRKEAKASIAHHLEPQAQAGDDIRPQFIILVNGSTVDWLTNRGGLNYFPVRRMLPNGLVAELKQKYPNGALVGETFLVGLECR
ncbi:hypothetical protein [Shinella zoogloeoides]|uniref:hypothetical protein n=1 Tax=Shinella zoogloeoides TaxID=352475 RepID=UPI00273E916B|nr:hypothetical protein [Shinella zoogloeoides]WLR91325.1 hypothetical protein Q9316_12480 [Shinella zoogloeoides]